MGNSIIENILTKKAAYHESCPGVELRKNISENQLTNRPEKNNLVQPGPLQKVVSCGLAEGANGAECQPASTPQAVCPREGSTF